MNKLEITTSVLENYWHELVGNSDYAEATEIKLLFVNAFRQLVQDKSTYYLNLETDAWKVELAKPIFKHLSIHAFASAIFQHFEFSELPVLLLATIIHLIFDAERIELDKDVENVHLYLVMRDEYKQPKTVEEWYQILPIHIRNQIHILDFKDIIDKLVYGGLAKNVNDKYVIYTLDDRKIKVHLVA